jgi:hypothetical protein
MFSLCQGTVIVLNYSIVSKSAAFQARMPVELRP